jgi:hypothetical protein
MNLRLQIADCGLKTPSDFQKKVGTARRAVRTPQRGVPTKNPTNLQQEVQP